jgi:hypothetical protein
MDPGGKGPLKGFFRIRKLIQVAMGIENNHGSA